MYVYVYCFLIVCMVEGLGVALSQHLFGVWKVLAFRLAGWASPALGYTCVGPGLQFSGQGVVCGCAAAWRACLCLVAGWHRRVWGGGNYWDGPALMSVISLHSHRL